MKTGKFDSDILDNQIADYLDYFSFPRADDNSHLISFSVLLEMFVLCFVVISIIINCAVVAMDPLWVSKTIQTNRSVFFLCN